MHSNLKINWQARNKKNKNKTTLETKSIIIQNNKLYSKERSLVNVNKLEEK